MPKAKKPADRQTELDQCYAVLNCVLHPRGRPSEQPDLFNLAEFALALMNVHKAGDDLSETRRGTLSSLGDLRQLSICHSESPDEFRENWSWSTNNLLEAVFEVFTSRHVDGVDMAPLLALRYCNRATEEHLQAARTTLHCAMLLLMHNRPALSTSQYALDQAAETEIEPPSATTLRVRNTKKGPHDLLITENPREARRGNRRAEFGSRDVAWKLFEKLCKRHPEYYSTDALGRDALNPDTLDEDPGANLVQQHIRALRKLLAPLEIDPRHTRGQGYRLEVSIPKEQRIE